MTYCKESSALLDPYIDGELSPEETARVREHLHTCDGCRAYVQAALAIRDAFPEAEDTPVPDGFAAGVMAAIRADAAPRKRRRPRWAKTPLGRLLCRRGAGRLRPAPPRRHRCDGPSGIPCRDCGPSRGRCAQRGQR